MREIEECKASQKDFIPVIPLTWKVYFATGRLIGGGVQVRFT